MGDFPVLSAWSIRGLNFSSIATEQKAGEKRTKRSTNLDDPKTVSKRVNKRSKRRVPRSLSRGSREIRVHDT